MFLKLCLAVLAAAAVAPTAEGAFLLTSSGSRVEVGVTPHFRLNCSYWGDLSTTPMINVTSIKIMRENEFGSYDLLAGRDNTGHITTSNILSSSCQVTGLASEVSNSFLAMVWPTASAENIGNFRCDINGLDASQKAVQESSPAITIQEVKLTINDVMDQLHVQTKAVRDYCESLVSGAQVNLSSTFLSMVQNATASAVAQCSCDSAVFQDIISNQTEELRLLTDELSQLRQNQTDELNQLRQSQTDELNQLKQSQTDELRFLTDVLSQVRQNQTEELRLLTVELSQLRQNQTEELRFLTDVLSQLSQNQTDELNQLRQSQTDELNQLRQSQTKELRFLTDELSQVKQNQTEELRLLTEELSQLRQNQTDELSQLRQNKTEELRLMADALSQLSQNQTDELNQLRQSQTEELRLLTDELSQLRRNQSRIDDVTAEINALKDKVALHGQVSYWPEGSYGLVMPESGCPVNLHSLWDSGYRKFLTASNDPSHNSVDPHTHLRKPVLEKAGGNDFLYLHFCTITHKSQGGPWPRGSYCIHALGPCPPNFDSGYAYISGDSNSPLSANNGSLPSINYGADYTQIFYCCRSDGPPNVAMYLPNVDPFYLYRYKGSCQMVEGMKVEAERVVMDTDFANKVMYDFFENGVHPDGDTNNWSFELCYYH